MDSTGHAHGFLLTSAVNGTYSDFDFPGAANTYVFGMNDLKQVVGDYGVPSGGGQKYGWGRGSPGETVHHD